MRPLNVGDITMKTKTLVDTLTTLKVIPSHQSDFGGEVLPESIVVKNILDEMNGGLDIVFKLRKKLDNDGDNLVLPDTDHMNPRVSELIVRLREAISEVLSRTGHLSPENYDADSEIKDRSPVKRRFSTRRKESRLRSSFGNIQTLLRARKLSTVFRAEDSPVVLVAREILALAHKDRNVALQLQVWDLQESLVLLPFLLS